MKRVAATCVFALWASVAFGAEGSPQHALLEQAVASYSSALDTADRGPRLAAFRRAERLFARVAQGESNNPELYTNVGNAALQAEHLGAAVLAYRRALAIDPDHPRAVQNLEYARTLLPEWVPRPMEGGLLDTFFSWHRTVARPVRALAAALAFTLAAGLLAVGIRFSQPSLRTAAVLPGLVWLALFASVILDSRTRVHDEAVVIAVETVARAADSALAPSALPAPLPGGTELRILERRSPWLRVRLANGRDAWVADSAVATVAETGGRSLLAQP